MKKIIKLIKKITVGTKKKEKNNKEVCYDNSISKYRDGSRKYSFTGKY